MSSLGRGLPHLRFQKVKYMSAHLGPSSYEAMAGIGYGCELRSGDFLMKIIGGCRINYFVFLAMANQNWYVNIF